MYGIYDSFSHLFQNSFNKPPYHAQNRIEILYGLIYIQGNYI